MANNNNSKKAKKEFEEKNYIPEMRKVREWNKDVAQMWPQHVSEKEMREIQNDRRKTNST